MILSIAEHTQCCHQAKVKTGLAGGPGSGSVTMQLIRDMKHEIRHLNSIKLYLKITLNNSFKKRPPYWFIPEL